MSVFDIIVIWLFGITFYAFSCCVFFVVSEKYDFFRWDTREVLSIVWPFVLVALVLEYIVARPIYKSITYTVRFLRKVIK